MALSDSEEPERLYFAYGSNLSTTQMQHRCPRSTPVGLAHLKGWTIINERGYANIVSDGQASGDRPGVYGLVYRLHADDELTLDICEGAPFAYEKMTVKIDRASLKAPELEPARSSSRGIEQPTGEVTTGPSGAVNLQSPGSEIELLAYVDTLRTTPSNPKSEYIDRINLGIKEALEWGLPSAYVDEVIRRCIPALS